MKKNLTKDIVEFMMVKSYCETQRYQKLIDKWNDPKDIAQRAAVLIRDVHKLYGKSAYVIYQSMEKK